MRQHTNKGYIERNGLRAKKKIYQDCARQNAGDGSARKEKFNQNTKLNRKDGECTSDDGKENSIALRYEDHRSQIVSVERCGSCPPHSRILQRCETPKTLIHSDLFYRESHQSEIGDEISGNTPTRTVDTKQRN